MKRLNVNLSDLHTQSLEDYLKIVEISYSELVRRWIEKLPTYTKILQGNSNNESL